MGKGIHMVWSVDALSFGGQRNEFPNFNKNTPFRVSESEVRERTDGELVRAALEGEQEAYGVLVTRYQRPAYLIALSVTGNPQDALILVPEIDVSMRCHPCKYPVMSVRTQPVKRLVSPME